MELFTGRCACALGKAASLEPEKQKDKIALWGLMSAYSVVHESQSTGTSPATQCPFAGASIRTQPPALTRSVLPHPPDPISTHRS